jgi:hypothetical protein
MHIVSPEIPLKTMKTLDTPHFMVGGEGIP